VLFSYKKRNAFKKLSWKLGVQKRLQKKRKLVAKSMRLSFWLLVSEGSLSGLDINLANGQA